MKKYIFHLSILFASCTTSEKKPNDGVASSDSLTAQVDSTIKETKQDTTVDPKAAVAMEFINDYVKHLDSGDPFDPMNWVENSELATDEFKASYKEIIAEGLRNETGMGLSYDPILNAQDNPIGFAFVRLDENEFVVVKGTDQPQFTDVIRIRFVANGWFVDGAGVVNIPEEKRTLK